MNIIRYPSEEDVKRIIERPEVDLSALNDVVAGVLQRVKDEGDAAVKAFEQQFDHVCLDRLQVSDEEFDAAEQQLSADLREAIRQAYQNIRTFHAAQLHDLPKVETCPGVTCWQKNVPIERVGLYVPGGTAPLFSTVLMLATPARLAGCREIVLCTPPSAEGTIHPAILFAARVAGVSRVFKIGGVQAIGAMAYGTASVPKVYKIFGPGNRFVMAAKQAVSLHDVAIDMPAGPSEVCVIADDTADAAFVAADLLSQAEHGSDSQVLLIATSEQMLQQVQHELDAQLQVLPRVTFATHALDNSRLVLVHNTQEAIALANSYAPEHLILQTADCFELAGQVVNAGSVFIGRYACESAGDYASGTNHTLPTHGYATAYSGVNMDSFNRKITFQHLTEEGIRSIGRTVELMAEAEELQAHKHAMTLRMRSLTPDPSPIGEGSSYSQGGDSTAELYTPLSNRRGAGGEARPNIARLQPYSSARDEYSGHEAHVFLDANENPYNSPYNRYPDPLQKELKSVVARWKGVRPECIFLGNGSDEAIDLVYRCFTRPGIDNVVAIDPTYGMYKVCADINDVAYRTVPLDDRYQLSADRLLAACDANTKVVWLCSPNNPTGNHLDREQIEQVLRQFGGIVVVDEAYAEFSDRRSLRYDLDRYPRLIVLSTFSKAWASAGVRLGMAFANEAIINIYNKVKYPYNVNILTQQYALRLLGDMTAIDRSVAAILEERPRLMAAVAALPCTRQVFPTDANFFLVRVTDAQRIYDYLVERGIIVRNRTKVHLCADCLRITIGTPSENDELICALKSFTS